jgi:acetyl-CoA synthetase
MIANTADEPVVPGSMGRPLRGVRATILARDDDRDGDPLVRDGVAVEAAPGTVGHLALRPGWPSMFRGYLGEPERYASCFAGGWYVSGDLARADDDGRFWFVGRADDVIKTAGHLVGPAEIEAVLRSHPAVADAAAVGIPHDVAGTVIKAFVVLAEGEEAGPERPRELVAFARRRLGPAIAPREVAVVSSIPVTRSGKILRRLLRARELGEPEGDLSTLEPTPSDRPAVEPAPTGAGSR